MKFLGFPFLKVGIQPRIKKLEVASKYLKPKNGTKMRIFLEIPSFFGDI